MDQIITKLEKHATINNLHTFSIKYRKAETVDRFMKHFNSSLLRAKKEGLTIKLTVKY